MDDNKFIEDFEFTSSDHVHFIKEHGHFDMRVPFFRKRLWVALAICVLLLITCLYTVFTKPMELSITSIYDILLVGLPLLLAVIFLLRFVRSTQFIRITTPFDREQNLKLLSQYLLSKQLLFYTQKDTIQIVSRQIYSAERPRECVIFIIDSHKIMANRVIINSILINSGWRTPFSSNFNILINDLRNWLSKVSMNK